MYLGFPSGLSAGRDETATGLDVGIGGYGVADETGWKRREARDFSRAPLDVLALMGTLGG